MELTDRPNRPAEAQILAVLGAVNEEAGEIVQVVGKIMRHGTNATDTNVQGDGAHYDNLDDLQTECGQMVGAILYACNRGLLKEEDVRKHAFLKLRKLTRIHG